MTHGKSIESNGGFPSVLVDLIAEARRRKRGCQAVAGRFLKIYGFMESINALVHVTVSSAVGAVE